MSPSSQTQRWLKTLIKVVVVVGLLYFLSQKGFLSLEQTKKAFSRWDLLVPAFAALLTNSFLGVIRWHWLLKAQGLHISFMRAFQLTYVGNFFNIALPGAVSGDFVKAFYVGKEIGGKRGQAFGSILFDRVAGLSALVLVSAAAATLGHDYISPKVIAAIRPVLMVAATCVVGFYAYLFLMRENYDPVLSFLRSMEKQFKSMGSFLRIYEGIRVYHHKRWTVLKVLLLSVFLHLVVGWVCMMFAAALGDDLAIFPIYLVAPLGLLVTAVPVAPAGVGTGHAAFGYFFKLIGSERGADVFTLVALCNLMIGGLGGLTYLRFRVHEPKIELEPVA